MRDVCLFLWTNKANYDPYDVMILSMCPLYAISLRSSLNDNYLFKTHMQSLQFPVLHYNYYYYLGICISIDSMEQLFRSLTRVNFSSNHNPKAQHTSSPTNPDLWVSMVMVVMVERRGCCIFLLLRETKKVNKLWGAVFTGHWWCLNVTGHYNIQHWKY